MDIEKSNEDTAKPATDKEGEKRTTGPDTDMLATLASAALEQDPKDKSVGGKASLVCWPSVVIT